jgi:glyoxylase-like metal-dependent hydrolase (beta-lactamase superfamily II)
LELLDPISEIGDGIWRIANRLFASNSYICATGEPGACFLVDPGTDFEVIEEGLGRLGLHPNHIFCTHGHFDHVGSAAHFQTRYGAPCYLHSKDLKTLRGGNFLMMAFRVPFSLKQPRVEEAEGLSMRLGGRELSFLPAPGHTPGSCLVQYGKALFTGDTLFGYGVGLSKLPEGDPVTLKATLLGFWDSLPGDALVLPGHGDSATFANIQRNNLPLLRFLGLLESSEQKR